MPELPEVEITCQGISPHIQGKTISDVVIRQAQLRWLIPDNLPQLLKNAVITSVTRRAKYILLATDKNETILLHLGMSGNLRITTAVTPIKKHDHVDFVFSDGTILRYNDTRRFGCILSTSEPIESHKLIESLGVEPLSEQFTGEYLFQQANKRKVCIKTFIMNAHYIVGVGNIYANEALFMAGIHPNKPAGDIALKRYQRLEECIKIVLARSIKQGGTTLRDFVNEQGEAGYFQQSLAVYGRKGEECIWCSNPIQHIKIAQRASYFCEHCQT